MGNRKGLFHIVEIVLISLVLFFLLSQAFRFTVTEPEWGTSKLITQGRDALFSMDAMGVDWSDAGELDRHLDRILNRTRLNYRLELRGMPHETVTVGCLCDGSAGCRDFCTWLDGVMGSKDLSFSGLKVNFTVIETDTIGDLYDVMVSTQGLEGLERLLPNYLMNNKGFVLVRDLDSADFAAWEGMLMDYFAVAESGGSGSGSVQFNLYELAYYPDYNRVTIYFRNMPNGTGSFYGTDHVFGPFSSEPVAKTPTAEGKAILRTGSGHPASIMKLAASSNRGRTAWLSYDTGREDDWSVFLASLVMWASEHRRVLIESDMQRISGIASMHLVPGDPASGDFIFNPVEAVLTMGHLY